MLQLLKGVLNPFNDDQKSVRREKLCKRVLRDGQKNVPRPHFKKGVSARKLRKGWFRAFRIFKKGCNDCILVTKRKSRKVVKKVVASVRRLQKGSAGDEIVTFAKRGVHLVFGC